MRERQDLEEWIKHNPDILGCRLLIVTSEFDGFDRSDKRLDLLAIDTEGKLVIIELKRDIARSLADLQAIRYAAFCSTMTLDDVVDLYAEFASIETDEAKRRLLNFIQKDEFASIDKKTPDHLSSRQL